MHTYPCICSFTHIYVCVCVFKYVQMLLTWTSHPRVGLDVCGKQLSRTHELDEISCARPTHVSQTELGAHRKLTPFLEALKEGTGCAVGVGGAVLAFSESHTLRLFPIMCPVSTENVMQGPQSLQECTQGFSYSSDPKSQE